MKLRRPTRFHAFRKSRHPAGDRETAPAETRIGPVVLNWEINVTAVVAFVVSMFALLPQAIGYWKGSQVTLHPVEKVLLNTDGSAIRIGSRMAYTNDGVEGYNALVLAESVSMYVGTAEYRQWAETRGVSDVVEKKAVFKDPVDAAPFMVPGMQLVTHESYFAARESHPVIPGWKTTPQQFIDALIAERAHGGQHIDFVFRARSREISGRHAGREAVLSTKCSITLDDGLIRRMQHEGWTSRTCWISG